jgi:hypothetical protein
MRTWLYERAEDAALLLFLYAIGRAIVSIINMIPEV